MSGGSVPSYPNVWIGTEIGLLKSVDLVKKVAANHFFKENYGKEQELFKLCWGTQNKESLFTGHRNGIIRNFNIKNNSFSTSFKIPDYEHDKEKLVGMFRNEDNFITCTSRGNLKLWNENDTSQITNISTGNDTNCLAYQPTDNLLATGGKENCLKLWDANSPEHPIFIAKNVKHDWLQLRVPIMVMNIKFIPNSSKILTTTGTHSIRIYDPKSPARRPVMEHSFGEHPIQSAAVCERMNKVVVGNTRGEVAAFDTRKLKYPLRCYKGFSGSVREIVLHSTLPYIFSCSLDRHLYVHHEDQSKVLQKVYLKSRLNCLLASDDDIVEVKSNSPEPKKRKVCETAEEDEEEEEDDMWENMEHIDDSESDSEIKPKKSQISKLNKRKKV